MDIDLLKTFVEVVRTRHFGKAAENLYITQSAVSFRIRQLEQGLGVNLFIRQRNNIQLTAPGERLLPHAQMIITGMQRAKVDVALADNMHKQICLAGTPNIWDAFLQFGITNIVSAMPGVSLVGSSTKLTIFSNHSKAALCGFLFGCDKLCLDKSGR